MGINSMQLVERLDLCCVGLHYQDNLDCLSSYYGDESLIDGDPDASKLNLRLHLQSDTDSQSSAFLSRLCRAKLRPVGETKQFTGHALLLQTYPITSMQREKIFGGWIAAYGEVKARFTIKESIILWFVASFALSLQSRMLNE